MPPCVCAWPPGTLAVARRDAQPLPATYTSNDRLRDQLSQANAELAASLATANSIVRKLAAELGSSSSARLPSQFIEAGSGSSNDLPAHLSATMAQLASLVGEALLAAKYSRLHAAGGGRGGAGRRGADQHPPAGTTRRRGPCHTHQHGAVTTGTVTARGSQYRYGNGTWQSIHVRYRITLGTGGKPKKAYLGWGLGDLLNSSSFV